MNGSVDTQLKIESLMISKNGVIKMEDPYSEWDGDYRKYFNTWISKKTNVITKDPDLYFNLMKLESNSLWNLSEQDDKGWNITPYNAFSGGYISCGWKTQTDSKVPDDLNILLKID